MHTRPALFALSLATLILMTACALIPTPAPTPAPTPKPPTPAPSPTARPAPSPTPVPALDLDGTDWVLATLRDRPPLAGTTITLSFDQGKAAGSDGCNRYSTSYTRSGSKLTIDKTVISTKMACQGPVMQQAQAYIAALTAASGYKSDGKRLVLVDSGGQALAEFSVQGQSLGGTSWLATAVNNGKGGVENVLAKTKLTLEFKSDGAVTGTGGCNSFGGEYTVSGKQLKITGLVSTLMGCATPAGVMEQESRLLKSLESAATYRIEGDTLEIRRSDGATAATFDKVR